MNDMTTMNSLLPASQWLSNGGVEPYAGWHLAVSVVFAGCGGVLTFVVTRELRNRRPLPIGFVLLLFATLVLASGLVLLCDTVGQWRIGDRWRVLVKVNLAVVSIAATVSLVRRMPVAYTLGDRRNLELAADELRQSKERFDRALRGAESGLWEWNVQEDEVWFSPRFKELLGYDDGEFPDDMSSLKRSLHRSNRTRTLKTLKEHFETETPYDDRFRLRTKSEGYRWFQARGLAIRDPSGRPYLMAGSIQDIHERMRAQAMVRRRNRQLRQAQKMEAVGTLAGGIAHEFNNLLQAIQAYTRFGMEGLDESEKRHQDLQQVIRASDRAAALTRQLLGFSRQKELQLEVVEVNSVVQEFIEMLRPILGEPIEICLDLDDVAGFVRVDVGQLQQVLMNLCLNARDSMPEGGSLTIRTGQFEISGDRSDLNPTIRAGRYGVVSVTDSGAGISPDIKDRIFDPFFTTKEVGEGTGLGLAVAYGIVRQHSGAIGFENGSDGASFQVYLPSVDQADSKEFSVCEMPSRGGTGTILIAEDDPQVREIAVRTLQNAGFQTLAVDCGEDAIRLFEEQHECISLALLDAVMPRVGGSEAARKMRERSPALPVLICTGYDPHLAINQTSVDEKVEVISKPYNAHTLLRRIRDTLDSRQCPA